MYKNGLVFSPTVTLITEVFFWHAKNGEKRKTSEEIVSISCWVCAISRPGVWTSYTDCVTGFSLSRHSRAWTVCISASQNGARLIKIPREEIGPSLVLKLHCVMLNRILTRYLQRFFFSHLFSRARENLCHQGSLLCTCMCVFSLNNSIVYTLVMGLFLSLRWCVFWIKCGQISHNIIFAPSCVFWSLNRLQKIWPDEFSLRWFFLHNKVHDLYYTWAYIKWSKNRSSLAPHRPNILWVASVVCTTAVKRLEISLYNEWGFLALTSYQTVL